MNNMLSEKKWINIFLKEKNDTISNFTNPKFL